MKRLEETGYRGVILGGEGTGKTTLLEDLEPRLRELDLTPVRLRLSVEAPRFSPMMDQMLESRVTPRHILLFDGSEQLGWWAWQKFRWENRGVGGLIITRRTPGRLPTLFRCGTSVDLLEGIVSELAQGQREIDRALLEKLFRRHRGNIRLALKDLYDRFALGRMKLAPV